MLKQAWNTLLTANDETAQEELGALREEYSTTYGYRQFRYVQAASDTTVASGTPLAFVNLMANQVTSDISDANPNQPAGVGIGAITASYYGWIQIKGYHGGVLTDGGDDIMDGDTLILHATSDGVCERSAYGTASPYKPLGVALAVDIDDNNTVTAFIDC